MERVRLHPTYFNDNEVEISGIELDDIMRWSGTHFARVEDLVGYKVDHVEVADNGDVYLTLEK